VVPIVAIILVGIVDMSRVFTAVVTVESAVREAADYGAWRSDYWDDSDPLDPAYLKTEKAMVERACIASANLSGYVGPTDGCANPRITKLELVNKNLTPASDCDRADRSPGPCWVHVEMEYTHDLIAPVGFDFFGTRIGLPSQLTFRRDAIFAISDFTTDQP
jgi:hypothetical protein